MIDALPSDIFTRGQVLNNTYHIEGVLGRGGTGEVYRARNDITGRVVAIKALNASYSGNADYIELMKREEEMRNIVNDAVVRYSDCTRTDEGHVVLVMDYIDGESLNDLMLARRMDVRELLIVAHRVVQGLATTHAHGIVHRDLSPDNMILRDGAPDKTVIIDFGIAKDTAAGARTIVGNDFAGKYEYAAPEQLEGQAEPRSDLYGLGASLLAAWRGEVPFAGATPGEIIRRKQAPLDTEGVPEPLKELVDWLTAPELSARAPDAGAVGSWLDGHLNRPERDARPTKQKPRRKTRWLVPLLLLLIAGGGGAYFSGALGRFFVPPLEDVSPYRLIATHDPEGASRLEFNAPDAATATQMRAAFAQITGVEPPEDAAKLAGGIPDPAWATRLAEMFGELRPLQRWDAEASDMQLRIGGVAPDTDAREQIATALSDWATGAGFQATVDIAAGPLRLSAADIQPDLDGAASCGPLETADGPAAVYGLNDTITITGNIAAASDTGGIEAVLKPLIGDRTLRMETTVMNDHICAVRDAVSARPSTNVSIWLGKGATGEANLSGVYTIGENPLAEVQVPVGIEDASLWVLIVDTDGEVYHILPNLNQTSHNVGALGEVRGGIRQIRVLHSVEEFIADNTLRAFRITDGDFGKSEIVAILTRDSLFDTRRPAVESASSVAAALSDVMNDPETELLGVATRIIDAQP